MGARSDCALEKPWKKALNGQEHRSGRVESAWMGSSRGSAGGFCLEGGGEGAGALQVPFRGHGKPQRMGPVKSLTTSQVLPYNLSQTIKIIIIIIITIIIIIIIINPLPLQPSGQVSNREARPHHSQGRVGPSSWLLRASWESLVPVGLWRQQGGGRGGPRDSDPAQWGGSARRDSFAWRRVGRELERGDGRALF